MTRYDVLENRLLPDGSHLLIIDWHGLQDRYICIGISRAETELLAINEIISAKVPDVMHPGPIHYIMGGSLIRNHRLDDEEENE